MKFASFAALLAGCVVLVAAQDNSIAAVEAAFRNAKIPGDLHINFRPTELLEVTFPQASGSSITLHAGVQLPRNATVGPPTFAVRGLTNAPRGQKFVVAAVDPDAPTPQTPTSAQIRHFLGGDFTLGQSTGGGTRELVSNTPPVSGFLQPTPPAGSDAHRYVFLLFRQPAGFDNQTTVTPATSIANFNISAFAQEVGLGNPLAGSFMLVAPDPSA